MVYPYNLICRIYGLTEDHFKEKYSNISKDQLDGLEYMISQLPAKERSIIQASFKDKLCWEDIGQLLNMDKEKVSLRIETAIKKLRSDSLKKYFENGLEAEKQKGEEQK